MVIVRTIGCTPKHATTTQPFCLAPDSSHPIRTLGLDIDTHHPDPQKGNEDTGYLLGP